MSGPEPGPCVAKFGAIGPISRGASLRLKVRPPTLALVPSFSLVPKNASAIYGHLLALRSPTTHDTHTLTKEPPFAVEAMARSIPVFPGDAPTTRGPVRRKLARGLGLLQYSHGEVPLKPPCCLLLRGNLHHQAHPASFVVSFLFSFLPSRALRVTLHRAGGFFPLCKPL